MDSQIVDIFLNNALEIVFSVVIFIFFTNIILHTFLGFDLKDIWNWIAGLFSSRAKARNKAKKRAQEKEKEMKDYGL